MNLHQKFFYFYFRDNLIETAPCVCTCMRCMCVRERFCVCETHQFEFDVSFFMKVQKKTTAIKPKKQDKVTSKYNNKCNLLDNKKWKTRT